ncbi:hypothetical protein RMSM_03537 [Rhodopirellula maiorica SM1]|uniref:Uncharacterized protein n=1 Tax=Rhodopirellula maiorica SM1 TaxID=1265738 RepID=M5RJN9_9BACT|nr:hypothetical protein RMSM_03537 [Rhodopirellula maiorica SM1]
MKTLLSQMIRNEILTTNLLPSGSEVARLGSGFLSCQNDVIAVG